MSKITFTNIEIINLMREIFGGPISDSPAIKGILNCELTGTARKKLSMIATSLRPQYNGINKRKFDLLKIYGIKIGNSYSPILPDDNGNFASTDDELKFKSYSSEMTAYMLEEFEVEVELLTDDELPTTSVNYGIVFSKLVQKQVVDK